MPLETSDFPEELQVAFFMFDLLSDQMDGMSGAYLGKDWSQCSQLFEIFEIENPKETLYFMKMYERKVMKYEAEKLKKEQEAEERRAKQKAGGGKNYTHNVRG